MIKEKKVTSPKKGAARKWSQRLKEIGEQRPSDELLEILNRKDKSKKDSKESYLEDWINSFSTNTHFRMFKNKEAVWLEARKTYSDPVEQIFVIKLLQKESKK